MTIKDIQKLANEQGLFLTENIKFNEMGVDFRVGYAIDIKGQRWVLRIPRRGDMSEQIDKEKRILQLVKKHLFLKVPDWKIISPHLIAYPLIEEEPALTVDTESHNMIWNMDKDSPKYIISLAKALVQLHAIPKEEVRKNHLKIMKPSDLRPEIANQLQTVKSELGISSKLELRYRKWLDDDKLWPNFTQFVHGDLYAGHVLTSQDGVVAGIIDWSTAHLGDPAIDFSGHVAIFGEASLRNLITEYENQGGKTWDKIYEQVIERASASALSYGYFALETNNENHIIGAKVQLGVI
ncbi:Mph(E)/Mph(G) family macrolide 2'-phosphotransferase [Myroides sp. 1354]|uniref:Mph(E)/Mph(G) family macrolide 2'-phosphotransferase n=1 Tax=unclassified Myroides TaxID=2642485 RepID=UPI002575F3DE|nr:MULTISPECIES: Mph(E)/Mph(G) family macrolide 2'-phosphotransferase [unclassified Myroides]MDM1044725.1 Mph(E)/Mph(G) family macrolide 2'-phosphotransferase [Myroides sp. R163-1]MDM1055438.1 Mph(E)/Mph(G) family macrolide 2'-phosphotransferase [Myroides sp. 1354]MDM1068735.1 Mph(E)/Mph(G) family macrolide 2'-phosphotransferase [Myroides sp. 1372]